MAAPPLLSACGGAVENTSSLPRLLAWDRARRGESDDHAQSKLLLEACEQSSLEVCAVDLVADRFAVHFEVRHRAAPVDDDRVLTSECRIVEHDAFNGAGEDVDSADPTNVAKRSATFGSRGPCAMMCVVLPDPSRAWRAASSEDVCANAPPAPTSMPGEAETLRIASCS